MRISHGVLALLCFAASACKGGKGAAPAAPTPAASGSEVTVTPVVAPNSVQPKPAPLSVDDDRLVLAYPKWEPKDVGKNVNLADSERQALLELEAHRRYYDASTGIVYVGKLDEMVVPTFLGVCPFGCMKTDKAPLLPWCEDAELV